MNVLHVVAAVFLVGPMAILPMTALRSLRARDSGQVRALSKSVNLYTLLSLIVVFFGFGALGLAGKSHNLSVTTPWILISILLYIVALILNLAVVVPALRRAADELPDGGPAGGNAGAGDGGAAALRTKEYPRVAMGSGISALLLVAVVVLMVWKP
ncbi:MULTISPECIES: DUF2269 family protein [unclassified Arthrobacter]|uniref:DUF2269 family protein n=1 Tax=unclassified Arthrobacter TaxID=235627 RepID=UPI00210E2B4F|nr:MULTISPECIES: DUF2269 family protein [unclassified Arthrobacter]MCQ9164896.1 DUF2269 domain-containing protein [Arthrobacter sp. STN4]